MFGDVWRWAGAQQRRVTNIGVEPHLMATQSRLLFDDTKFWRAEGVLGPDELAARAHCRLVSVHPFTNGNGRGTRLIADL
jgi:fido (protein-threonine AMPylation protein)